MKCLVTLYCEQFATLEVDADPNATNSELTQLALLELDKSGGAEWETASGWVESRQWLDQP
jgi:hypothetical protein